MYVCMYVCNVCMYVCMYAKQKHLGCKKCEAKKNQRLKALISARAKKFSLPFL